ncbi:hypothetical protein [Pseudomonas sp.]|uniref:hypothetical protein n=1 Tax=Pseudomonas sp. TaxID=306 RepID=UPI003A96E0D2
MFFDDFVLARNAKVSNKVRQALVQDYSRPEHMEAAFKLYSAWVEQDANDNLEFSRNKLTAPLLTIGGDHSRGKTLAAQALYMATQPHSLILVEMSQVRLMPVSYAQSLWERACSRRRRDRQH